METVWATLVSCGLRDHSMNITQESVISADLCVPPRPTKLVSLVMETQECMVKQAPHLVFMQDKVKRPLWLHFHLLTKDIRIHFIYLFIFKICFIFKYVPGCGWWWLLSAHACKCPQRPAEGGGSPGARIRCSWKLPSVEMEPKLRTSTGTVCLCALLTSEPFLQKLVLIFLPLTCEDPLINNWKS